jgi:RNA polymerase sigma-70 factor (ECF subfamily)
MQTQIDARNSGTPAGYGRPVLKILSGTEAAPDIMRRGSAKRRENDDMKHMADCIRAVAERQDREAFRELFAFYAPRLKAFLIKRGASAGEAEDVMQEALTLVWRKAAQFDPAKASVSTWIYTIARNRRIDLIRRAKRPELDPEDPFFSSVSEQPDGEQEYTRNERAKLVRTYLKTLPAEQLQVVQKAFYEEMTHQKIAAELDMPLGTVKSRIRIAMRRLRDHLDGAEL